MRFLTVAVLLSVPLLATAEAEDVSINQVLNEIPACGSRCYRSTLSSSADNSSSPVSDFCYEEGHWGKAQECILLQCSTLDRYRLNKVQSKVCDQSRQNRYKRFYIIVAAEIPAWISPWLRFLASWKSYDGHRSDDYIMLACGIIYTVYLGCIHYVQHTIFDVNSSTIGPDDMSSGLEVLFIADKFALVCLALSKVAIIYINLRTGPSPRLRVMALTTLAFIIVPTLVFFFVSIFQCSPISFAWEGWTNNAPPHTCHNSQVISNAKLAVDIVQNVILVAISLPLLRQPNMGLCTKLGAALIFAIGGLALAMACLRLQFSILQGAKPNQPWQYSDQIIWTGVEISALILVACLPNISKLFPAFCERKPAILTSRMRTRSNRNLKDQSLSQAPAKPEQTFSRKNPQNRGIYGPKRDEVTLSQLALDLHLGDKDKGDVWTQIKAGHRFSSFSILSHVSDKLGIRVKTTTRIDVEDLENDERAMISPKAGPSSP
ncbi:hypothetical protein BGZ63DRAFT_383161 [Mariannaea sp. PMI_226]|nr:hypothetical protein BGZ63DRAFT_383161 [Mariannaea sp. PMI_226]